MSKLLKLTLGPHRLVDAVQIHSALDILDAIAALGLPTSRPVLVLVGGASGISAATMTQLRSFFNDLLAPLVEELGLTVIDGGTDAGVMQLMGQARAHIQGTFPLVGVAAIGTVKLPQVQAMFAEAAALEPNHTQVILVPGRQWGDESPWISQVASELAQSAPAATLLVNGGQITWKDATNSVLAGRSLVVLAGSGRTADTLAAMYRGMQPNVPAGQLMTSGLMQVIDLAQPFGAIAATLRSLYATVPPGR